MTPDRSKSYEELELPNFLNRDHADPVLSQTAKTLFRALRTKDLDEVLQRLPNTASLVLSRDPWSVNGPPLTLAFLRFMPSLTELQADFQKSIDGVLPIRGLLLRKLSLKEFGLVDLHQLGPMPGLQELELGGCQLQGVDVLATFRSLTHLGLSKAGLTGAEFLEHLTGLVTLDLTENNISRLAPLQGLTVLRVLRVAKNMVDDLTPLSKLRALKEVDISENSVADLDPLTFLRDLQTLRFTRNRVRSVKPLKDLDLLQTVSLALNPLHEDEIDEILRRRVRIE